MDQFLNRFKCLDCDIDVEDEEYISRLEEMYFKEIISPKKKHGEMVSFIENQLGASRNKIADLGGMTAESVDLLFDLEKSEDDESKADRVVWVLPENESNKVFYNDFNECYYRMNAEPKIVIVYLEAKDSFVSNSSLLEFALLIYRGMNQEEMDKKTPEYKNYLNTIYMLGEMLENIDE